MANLYQIETLQSAAVATGNGTAITTTKSPGAAISLVMQVVGITAGSAIVTFEATIDGANWVEIKATNLTSGAVGSTAEDNGLYRVSCQGLLKVRARVSSYISGSVTVTGIATEY